MIRAAVAAVVLSFFVAAASAAEMSFDQGVDARAVLQTIGRETRSTLIVPAGMRRHLQWMPGCQEVSMAPGISESPVYELASTELVEECDTPSPRDPGGCRQTFGETIRRNARLVVENRPATNSTEVFQLCLTGDRLSASTLRSSVRYMSLVDGDSVVLTPEPPESSAPMTRSSMSRIPWPWPPDPSPAPWPTPEPPQAPLAAVHASEFPWPWPPDPSPFPRPSPVPPQAP